MAQNFNIAVVAILFIGVCYCSVYDCSQSGLINAFRDPTYSSLNCTRPTTIVLNSDLHSNGPINFDGQNKVTITSNASYVYGIFFETYQGSGNNLAETIVQNLFIVNVPVLMNSYANFKGVSFLNQSRVYSGYIAPNVVSRIGSFSIGDSLIQNCGSGNGCFQIVGSVLNSFYDSTFVGNNRDVLLTSSNMAFFEVESVTINNFSTGLVAGTFECSLYRSILVNSPISLQTTFIDLYYNVFSAAFSTSSNAPMRNNTGNIYGAKNVLGAFGLFNQNVRASYDLADCSPAINHAQGIDVGTDQNGRSRSGTGAHGAPDCGAVESDKTVCAVTTSKITTHSVTTHSLTTSKITTHKLTTLGGTTHRLTTSKLTTSRITSSALTTQGITTNSVTSSALSTAFLTTASLTTASVTSAAVTSLAVSSAPLSSSAITSAQLTSSALSTSQITSSELTSASITSSDITTSQVTSSELTTFAMTSASLSTSELTSSALTSSALTSSSLTTAGMTSGAVTSGALTTHALDMNAVDFCQTAVFNTTNPPVFGSTILPGYFCITTTTFYECVKGQPELDATLDCPAGTTCNCAQGIECSENGTRSPCVTPSSNK